MRMSSLTLSYSRLNVAKRTGLQHGAKLSQSSSPAIVRRSRLITFATSSADTTTLPRFKLGSSDMEVTQVCLGTMTWGMQNTEADGHAQMDYAVKDRGVNFIDTAEMYPVPSSAPGWQPGATEEIIGTWLQKNPALRSEVVIATKVSGFNPKSETVANRTVPPTTPLPDGRLDSASIHLACDASLRRLQTDYIDLYQLHWPDRYLPSFGMTAYNPEKERPDSVPIRETVAALKELIDAGKIRHYGLSNETTFGVCEFVRAADELGCPRPVSIQNSFCLLHRSFETELAEACAPTHYDIGLLPWTPLAGGALTGKYLGGARPEGARFTKYPRFMSRYQSDLCMGHVAEYQAIADRAGLSLATLALAWCKSRWYCSSTIIGATTHEQLKENIDAFTVDLDQETLDAIDAVHMASKDPCMLL